MFSGFAEYSPEHFNSLLDVDEADRRMRADNILDAALKITGPLFLHFGVWESWGLCLLHKHWEIDFDEIPLQNREEYSGFTQYRLQPRMASEVRSAVPSVLCASNGKFIGLEYSTSAHVVQSNEIVLRHPDFLTKLADTLNRSGLARVFGLISTIQDARAGFKFVESTRSGRVSVLRETPISEVSEVRLIETSWRFSPMSANTLCVSNCLTSCVQFCNPNSDGSHSDGGHLSQHQAGHFGQQGS